MSKRGLQEQSDRPLKKQRNDIASCVSKLIKETLFPDYKDLCEEIQRHEFISMRLNLGRFNPDTGDEFTAPVWAKALFVLPDCAIVQEVQVSYDATRFKTYKVMFGQEWEQKFAEYIGSDHEQYEICLELWQDGMRYYGADV